ncbi:hypothetical protein ACFL3Q_06580 [Planctomycetota bacterium]
MPESLKCKKDNERNGLISFIPFWICVALVFILAYILGMAPIKKYKLADSDCYLRLLRVEDLHKGGNWYDPVVLRINPPHGQTSHWTRPFDVLLLAGALPIALFTDFESALFWWGVMISPVLLIATLIALQWSTKPIFSLSKDGPFFACIIFVLQITGLSYYQSGRPDHHSLIIFFFILSIGFTFRIILRPINTLLCYIAGAIGALSMWISVESMVPVGITIGVLGLFWLLEDGDFLDKSLHYTLALFMVTGLSLVLERAWHGLLAEEYDRLSIVHLSVFGFITILWTTLFVLNRYTLFFRRRANRFSSILVGLAMLALALLVTFPKFYKGPFADIDPRIIPIILNKISELQPLISRSESLLMPVQILSSAIVCFSFLFYLLLWKRHDESWKGWLFITLSSVAFILFSLNQVRWSIYLQVLLSIPLARIIVLMRQRGPKTGFLKTLKNVSIVLVFSSAFLLLGLLADAIFKKGDSEKKHQKVSLVRICDYLSQAEEWYGRDLLILTHVDFGAEILYRTEHKVLSTTHHRSGQEIWDTYEIMTADTNEKALELIQRRKIDLILLCPKSTESIFYSKPEKTYTFYQRLLDDKIPNWSRKVELPSDLSSSFLLFETIEGSESR